mmetsp:Transcript_3998/g.11305  ORF Transcript_3998/g.11305 Transcript_3998/m.11305 type:complete len:259 (+) Transcript_3998:76-852(+)
MSKLRLQLFHLLRGAPFLVQLKSFVETQNCSRRVSAPVAFVQQHSQPFICQGLILGELVLFRQFHCMVIRRDGLGRLSTVPVFFRVQHFHHVGTVGIPLRRPLLEQLSTLAGHFQVLVSLRTLLVGSCVTTDPAKRSPEVHPTVSEQLLHCHIKLVGENISARLVFGKDGCQNDLHSECGQFQEHLVLALRFIRQYRSLVERFSNDRSGVHGYSLQIPHGLPVHVHHVVKVLLLHVLHDFGIGQRTLFQYINSFTADK